MSIEHLPASLPNVDAKLTIELYLFPDQMAHINAFCQIKVEEDAGKQYFLFTSASWRQRHEDHPHNVKVPTW